jgi:hypothetical protein
MVPSALLSKLPLALDWSQIQQVAKFNAALRKVWNTLIASASKRKTRITKRDIREMLFSDASFLADLVKVYRSAVASGYDFEADPDGLFDWFVTGLDAANANPLDIK